MDKIISWIVFGAFGAWLVWYSFIYQVPQYELDARAKKAEECAKPIKATEAEGVELWAYNWCTSYPVYFSKTGASWNEQRPHGKTTEIVPMHTSNTEVTK